MRDATFVFCKCGVILVLGTRWAEALAGRRSHSSRRWEGRPANIMADKLIVKDARRGSVEELKADILTVIDILVSKRKLRGRQKGVFVTELSDWFFWLFVLQDELRERIGMAKTNGKQTEWRGFIDVKMTDAEKEMFSQWDVHDHDLFVLLSEAVAQGHKLSLTFNKQNDTFVCSFTGNEGTDKHEGYTLSAYGGDWYIAVRALVFKHVILLESDWKKAVDRPSEKLG